MAENYIRTALRDGTSEFKRQVLVAHKVIPAISSTPVAAVYYWRLFQREESKTLAMPHILNGLVSLILAYATVLFLIWLWYVFTAPARLHKKAVDEAKKARAEAATSLEEQRTAHAKEKADLQGQLDALQKENDEKPKLGMTLKTASVPSMYSANQNWQAVVEVCNTSKNKDIENVELFIDSVTPESAIKYITLPVVGNNSVRLENARLAADLVG